MTSQTKIFINGKEYNSLEEAPPEAREAYQSAMQVFQDKDGNGIPDIFEGKGIDPHKLSKIKEHFQGQVIQTTSNTLENNFQSVNVAGNFQNQNSKNYNLLFTLGVVLVFLLLILVFIFLKLFF